MTEQADPRMTIERPIDKASRFVAREPRWSDAQITDLARVGALISRHLRNAWTGEQDATSIPIRRLGGRYSIAAFSILESMELLAYENIADLNQVRIVKYGQHSWQQADWERAIRERM